MNELIATQGISITSISLAITKNKLCKKGISIEQMVDKQKSIIPMKRFGEPEEFADAVGFLASPAAGYITGINLPVDGGRTSCL